MQIYRSILLFDCLRTANVGNNSPGLDDRAPYKVTRDFYCSLATTILEFIKTNITIILTNFIRVLLN
jgi:hypothetical protein